MATRRVGDRSQVVPRRATWRTVVRALLTSAALVVLYYKLPMTGALNGSATVLLAGGLLAFVMLITWQVRAILRSQHPTLRAIEALAVAIPVFLLLFASTYILIADNEPAAFTEPLGKTPALYFTVTVFATVGFGDIVPKSEAARIVTTVQMLADLVVVGLVVRVLLGAARASRERSAGRSPGTPPLTTFPGDRTG
jgi:voltage-gated potassium channel